MTEVRFLPPAAKSKKDEVMKKVKKIISGGSR